MRVLIAQSDPNALKHLEVSLNMSGFQTFITDEAEDALDLMTIYNYDVVILDTQFPDMEGSRLLSKARKSHVKSAIIMITQDQDQEMETRCLNIGADDYVTKPFRRDTLVARINTVVRRCRGHSSPTFSMNSMIIDFDKKKVTVSGKPIHLTVKEYQMLELLTLRQEYTVTKEAFLNHLYGGMDEPELKIIDVFICKLRKKLTTADPDLDIIQTVWGRGYVLREKDHATDQLRT